jgi:hypothetical protein
MKLLDIRGNLVKIDVRPSSYPIREVGVSKLQKMVGDSLQENFPSYIILEEFTIPGSKLRLDFFLPMKMLAIEIDGRQHFERVQFFHPNNSSFPKQMARDDKKEDWCKINNIHLIRIIDENDISKIYE